MNAVEVLQKLDVWEGCQCSYTPMPDVEALAALARAGVSESDLRSKLEILTLGDVKASPRILVSYSDLQAINWLDAARQHVSLSVDSTASTLRAIFQACEVALLTISDLAPRIVVDIETKEFGKAEEKYRWVSSLQQTLHSYALLITKLPFGGPGLLTGLQHSQHAKHALNGLSLLNEAIVAAELIDPLQIGIEGLGLACRNLTHQAFTDGTFQMLWERGLSDINFPGLDMDNCTDERARYVELVGANELFQAVYELDQYGDNFLRQFRAFHQMSEVLARRANELIAASIKRMLGPDSDLLPEAIEDATVAIDLLTAVSNNIIPILRNLSVSRYQDIRGSLGITSGSHSPNIKRGLFTTLYPLFVEAVKIRAVGPDFDKYSNLQNALQALADSNANDPETHGQQQLLQAAIQLHVALRTWRELHFQLIDTHLGFSMETPTASIAGANNGSLAANKMLSHAHGRETDPIVPIFEALFRKSFPAPWAIHNRPRSQFVGKMREATVSVVMERSAEVQRRAALKALRPAAQIGTRHQD